MVQNRAILITLRAAAIVIIATGLNDVIASALPRYEPLYLYLAGIAVVALLDGVIVGLLTALLSLGFYALLFMPRAELLTSRIAVPVAAAIATAVIAAVLRGLVRVFRRRRSPEVERVFPVAPALLETSTVARVADNAEVLAAIDELRAELRAAVADLTATRDRADELEALRRSQNAEREAVEARARQTETERDWALKMAEDARVLRKEAERQLAEAREESATMAGRLAELELSSHEGEKLRTRIGELEEALAAAAPATEFDEIRRALADTRNTRDRARAEMLAEKQRADALERTLADERAAGAALEASLAEERAARAKAETALATEGTAHAQAKKALAEEGAGRVVAEQALEEERAARTSAEQTLAEERAGRATAEKQLEEERAARAATGKSLDEQRSARAAAETSLAEERTARVHAETTLATEGTAHAQAKQALAEERAARESAAAEFDVKLQKIVTHLASDHEADLGQAVSEREEARAEVRALRARLADLEKTAADERAEFDTRLQTIVTHLASDHETDLGQAMSEKEEARAEARALSMKLATVQHKLQEAETLLGETRTVAQAEIDRLRAQLGSSEPAPALPAARSRVLVVHPDAVVRSGAAASLERAGYDVVSAADGLEALRVAIAAQPEVVIAESSMPKMDGRELCALLKSQEKTAHIRFILLMRATDEAPRGELTPDEVLRKPVPVETLKATLASLLAAPR